MAKAGTPVHGGVEEAHIDIPGLLLSQVMSRVRRELAGIDQVPWDSSSLVHDFYFSAGPSAELPVPSTNNPAAPRVDAAEEFWSQIKASSNAEQFKEFMRTFPNSPLVHAARARLVELTGSLTVQTVPPSALLISV